MSDQLQNRQHCRLLQNGTVDMDEEALSKKDRIRQQRAIDNLQKRKRKH